MLISLKVKRSHLKKEKFQDDQVKEKQMVHTPHWGIRPNFIKHKSVTSRDLAKGLGKSQAMAKKILQRYQKADLVKKVGNGPSTSYIWNGGTPRR